MRSITLQARVESARTFASGRLAPPDQPVAPGSAVTLSVDAAQTWAVRG